MKFFYASTYVRIPLCRNGRCNSFALAAGNWWTEQVRPTTAQCRVLTCGQSTRAVALYANNKRTRVTSKLALWFFYHSRTALVVRGVAQLGFQPSCTRIPCAIDNKKGLSTSKLVSSPLLLSAPLIYVRDYCGCLPMYARIPPST